MKKQACPECGNEMEPTFIDGIIWDCPECGYTPPGQTAGFDVFVNNGELWKSCDTLDEATREGREAKKQFDTVAIYQMFTDGNRELVGLVGE